jgi:hypothetical protein
MRCSSGRAWCSGGQSWIIAKCHAAENVGLLHSELETTSRQIRMSSRNIVEDGQLTHINAHCRLKPALAAKT